MNRSFCEGCFEKQLIIDRLTEENQSLKNKLRYQERKAKEGFFGSSTPSSKVPAKGNSKKPKERKKRGAKLGHRGKGRRASDETRADKIETPASQIGDTCPDCGHPLEDKGFKERTVIDIKPQKPQEILYKLKRKYCPHCRRVHTFNPPSALPKSLYGNHLIASAATMHYLYGVPMGRLCDMWNLNMGTLIGIFHRLGGILEDVSQNLIDEYRRAPVKHADETGWRNYGQNGYAWLFATKKLSIFQFRDTRSATVPMAVFGKDPLPGALVVDRYAAYNKAPCKIQYCYSHLLRLVQDLEKKSPNVAEIKDFVNTMGTLLAKAMGLHAKRLSDRKYYERASKLKSQILDAVNHDAQNQGIRAIQDTFRRNENRLYLWADDRRVPADNNLAERDLRPTVIARKVSFGSQSEAGANTRSVIMTALHSLKKRHVDVTEKIKDLLDAFARDPAQNPYAFLFP